MHESPVAIASLEHLMGVVYDCTEDQVLERMHLAREFEPEEGNSILLSMRWMTKTGILLDLSALTEPELDTFRDFILHAVDLARPSVRMRDATAKEAESNGDYRFARSNRPDPKVSGWTRPV